MVCLGFLILGAGDGVDIAQSHPDKVVIGVEREEV